MIDRRGSYECAPGGAASSRASGMGFDSIDVAVRAGEIVYG